LKNKNKISGLYVISDTTRSNGRTHEEVVAAAVAGGAKLIQLREKALPARELYPVALRLRELTRKAGALFIINDSVELALVSDADGVHLGQDDMPVEAARKLLGPDRVIGVSTHSLEQALSAEREGADYIGFGPVFPTSTKDAGEAKGLDALREIRSRTKIPIVAIGGIDKGNAGGVIAAGADAVAVISAVTMAEDIREAVEKLAGALSGRSR